MALSQTPNLSKPGLSRHFEFMGMYITPHPIRPLSPQDPGRVSTSPPGVGCPSSGDLVTTCASGQPILPAPDHRASQPVKDIHPPSALSPASPPWLSSSAQPPGASLEVPHAPAVWPEGIVRGRLMAWAGEAPALPPSSLQWVGSQSLIPITVIK